MRPGPPCFAVLCQKLCHGLASLVVVKSHGRRRYPMTQILDGLYPPHIEKPHVFPEATYDVAIRNTCGFSDLTFDELKDA